MQPAGRGASAPELGQLLDTARFGSVQLIVLVCTFLVLVMDGFDIQAIAFVVPTLTQAWGIERADLGPVLAAALVGMALGAAGIGPLGDRAGRKPALLVSCALMAVGSLASAAAQSPFQLAVFRLITGLGLGGAMPNATALVFEFAPKPWRQLATSVALIGVLLGGVLGAALARSIIPELGWRALFILGGVLPALLGLAMWPLLPESPRFLSVNPRRARELARQLRRLFPDRDLGAELPAPALDATRSAAASSVRAVLTPELRRDTLILWTIFLTNVFSVYFFFNWLPTVLAAAQLDFRLAVTSSLIFNLGGIVGALIGAVCVGRLGSRKMLSAVTAVGVASVVGIGLNGIFDPVSHGGSLTVLMATMAIAGACINCLQIGMFSVAANAYPVQCRSTGLGWGLAVARFGGILSAFAGGSFFALGLPPNTFFFVIAGVLTIALLGVLALGRHIPPISE